MYLSVYSDGFRAGVETHLYNLLYLNLGYRFVHDHLSIYPSIHLSFNHQSSIIIGCGPRNIAGWVGSIGRSSVEAEQAVSYDFFRGWIDISIQRHTHGFVYIFL